MVWAKVLGNGLAFRECALLGRCSLFGGLRVCWLVIAKKLIATCGDIQRSRFLCKHLKCLRSVSLQPCIKMQRGNVCRHHSCPHGHLTQKRRNDGVTVGQTLAPAPRTERSKESHPAICFAYSFVLDTTKYIQGEWGFLTSFVPI